MAAEIVHAILHILRQTTPLIQNKNGCKSSFAVTVLEIRIKRKAPLPFWFSDR